MMEYLILKLEIKIYNKLIITIGDWLLCLGLFILNSSIDASAIFQY